MAGTNHHSGRPWRRLRLQVLDRDGWTCRLPTCKAAEWMANPPPRDAWLAAAARAWMAGQDTTRAIWRDAPKVGHRFHPLSASVDMVHPKSLGGSDRDPENLRASHSHCNGSRGNGTRRPQDERRYSSTAPRITS